MWFKTKLNNKVDVVKNNTIIENSDKLNEIYLILGEVKGSLKQINKELQNIQVRLHSLEKRE